MAETLTYDPTPADAPELNADEQDSLAVGEEMQAAQDDLLAGKYKDAKELESAYIELQKKLGERSEDSEEVKTVEEDVEPPTTVSFLNDASSEYSENLIITIANHSSHSVTQRDLTNYQIDGTITL